MLITANTVRTHITFRTGVVRFRSFEDRAALVAYLAGAAVLIRDGVVGVAISGGAALVIDSDGLIAATH
jgi:hypothetical protein